MNFNATLESANLRDLSAVRKLEKICFPLDAWPLLDLIAALSMPGLIRYKALVGEDVIGFAAGEVRSDTRTGWISTICVHPDYQRHGIGSKLLRLCEQELQMPRVRLTVRESNDAAINMYLAKGYVEINRWRGYYKGGEDGVVMEKLM